MMVEVQAGILRIGEVKELDGADSLCPNVRAVCRRGLQAVEIDLTRTSFINSSGVGDLIAVYKLVRRRAGKIPIRLLNPSGPVSQLLELTRLHEIFEMRSPMTEVI